MSDAISFRPMTAADIDAVLKIEYAAFSHPWTRGIFTDSLTSYNCWVMFEGEQQVGHGVIQIILDEAHLLNITSTNATGLTKSVDVVITTRPLVAVKMPW